MSSTLTLLFVGDIVGSPGLDAVQAFLPGLIRAHGADLVVANGENAMDGKSISEEQAHRLFDLGVHVITSGNHIWEKWHIQKLLAAEPRLLRPANYPRDNAGRGYTLVDLGARGTVGVLNLQGRAFMSPIECPFRTADWAVERMAAQARVIVVDMHAEATAEKIALARHLDGRVSAVIGTHTHVQTADAQILPEGTAYLTDAGMTGPHDSVVGMRTDIALRRFIRQTPHKFEPATGGIRLSAVRVDIDAATGRATHIETITQPEYPRDAARPA